MRTWLTDSEAIAFSLSVQPCQKNNKKNQKPTSHVKTYQENVHSHWTTKETKQHNCYRIIGIVMHSLVPNCRVEGGIWELGVMEIFLHFPCLGWKGVIFRTSSYTIEWNQGDFFPKVGDWHQTTPLPVLYNKVGESTCRCQLLYDNRITWFHSLFNIAVTIWIISFDCR